jgi:preprotein translocase subunit SecF
MEFFRIKRDIPFMSYGKLTTAISLITFILGGVFLGDQRLNFSVEFTGGTVMQVQYQQGADVNKIRSRLNTLNIGRSASAGHGHHPRHHDPLPNKGSDHAAQLSNKVMDMLEKSRSQCEAAQNDFIGPQVGEELITHGLAAIAMVCIGIIIYLASVLNGVLPCRPSLPTCMTW